MGSHKNLSSNTKLYAMTLIAVTAHHCPFRNLRNQTPNKPLPQHNTSNEAATMRDDEYARRYYDDLTEAKKQTIITRGGEIARARIAATTGYVDPEPTYPSTSRAQISHSWHTTDARRRIASIKRDQFVKFGKDSTLASISQPV
jgi:hypothetical protein